MAGMRQYLRLLYMNLKTFYYFKVFLRKLNSKLCNTWRSADTLNTQKKISTCWRGWSCKLSEVERRRSSEGFPQVLPEFPVRRKKKKTYSGGQPGRDNGKRFELYNKTCETWLLHCSHIPVRNLPASITIRKYCTSKCSSIFHKPHLHYRK